MRKVIATINITLDEFCDDTSMIADDELLHAANENAGAVIYG